MSKTRRVIGYLADDDFCLSQIGCALPGWQVVTFSRSQIGNKNQASIVSTVNVLVVKLAMYWGKEQLEQFSSLDAIYTPATGLNHIDTDYCDERGVKVFSLNDCRSGIKNIHSTTELTLGLILSLVRKIFVSSTNFQNSLEWNRDRYRTKALSEHRFGIIGCGRIGAKLSQWLVSLGCTVGVYDVAPDAIEIPVGVIHFNNLEELLSWSTVISVNASLSNSQQPIINSKHFDDLDFDGKYIVNTARAELVDEERLILSLETDVLAGYACDVVWDEYCARARAVELKNLMDLGKNIIVTQHLGGNTYDARKKTDGLIFDLIARRNSP